MECKYRARCNYVAKTCRIYRACDTSLENVKQQAEDAKIKLEASLQSEIARLRDEKEEQARAMDSKFETINQKLKQLQKPAASWWQKLMGA